MLEVTIILVVVSGLPGGHTMILSRLQAVGITESESVIVRCACHAALSTAR